MVNSSYSQDGFTFFIVFKPFEQSPSQGFQTQPPRPKGSVDRSAALAFIWRERKSRRGFCMKQIARIVRSSARRTRT